MIKIISQSVFTKHALKIIGRSNQKRRLTNQTKRHPVTEASPIDFKEEETILKKLVPQIREDVTNESLIYHTNMPKIKRQFQKLFDDAVENLKLKYLASPLTTINAYKHFKRDYTEEELMKAGILGWCFKLQDIAMIIIDDILDESVTRYNKPVLYRKVGIKQAITDSIYFETSANFLLLKHFSEHKYFAKIQKELICNLGPTTISQRKELTKYNLEDFEVYESLVKSFPFLIHGVSSAMYLANIQDPELHSIVKKFCMDICIFGKRYDDFTALVEPTTPLEKDNTDIAASRITWMAVQVSKLATPQQKKTFMEHYGSSDPKSISIIFDIYQELNLVEYFDIYREKFYDDMHTRIHNLPHQLPKQFFYDILDYAVINCFYA
ncbi:farnesyl pyrophosphate synthase-like [Diabrotica undecimpunctata]|uniref:farnesyl pyrophosphate synthase-like n=1 Tax=Diabrotica undecimpunctata TaxID=50387 RepID=UPI003B63DEB0